MTAEDVARAASFGDPVAVALLGDAGRRIGSMLASIVNFFNPSLIVIGGGVANSPDQLLAAIRETIYRRSLPLATRDLLIQRSSLGGLAGVIGASSMVVDQLFSRESLGPLDRGRRTDGRDGGRLVTAPGRGTTHRPPASDARPGAERRRWATRRPRAPSSTHGIRAGHRLGGAVLSRTTSSVASSTRIWTGLLTARHGEDQLGGCDRHLEERLADRRQRRPDPAGDRQVVEADDTQVLRDVESGLARGLVDAERLEVVARDDRGRAIRRGRSSARPLRTPSSTWNWPWLVSSGSTGTPAASIAAR